jgi:hypothetical protein
MKNLLIILLLVFISGCSNTSIMSYKDKSYFLESPHIVKVKNKYFLKFQFSDNQNYYPAFAMNTWSKIKNNKLLFYIPATTSSGDRSGIIQYEQIINKKKITLLENNSVYWVEPNNTLIKLQVLNVNNELINHIYSKH